MTKSKVKSRSDDAAQLHPQTNVPTKYQLPTPYGFLRYSLDKIFKLKVTIARSNQDNTMTLHTYTPQTIVPTKYHHPAPHSF